MRGWTNDSSSDDATRGSIRILSPGCEVGERYEIDRVLGVGGYGVVYAAFDRHLHRKVALKVLRNDRLNDAALRRFRREVAIAHDVESPHLVRVFDIAQSEESTYLTMELIEGEPLSSLVARSPLPVDDVIAIAAQILRALDVLHRVGIVHRDVKPSNVMLASGLHVKLTDFGLARRIDSETRATETASVVGTLEYLSPEQAMGLEIDTRSDLYALGIVLYECLTGDVPLRGGSSLGTAIAHISKSAPDVRTRRPDTPRWLAAMIARLLKKEPRDRYQSATEVLRDLERRRPPAKTIRRDRLLVAVLVIAGVAGIAAGYRELQSRRFASLVSDGAVGAHAVDRRGRILWSDALLAPTARSTTVVLKAGASPLIAAIRHEQGRPDNANSHRLLLLNPEDGRQLSAIALPQHGHHFPDLSNGYVPGAMMAVDIDHDGAQEIVVCFNHHLYWPSYTIFVDPARKVAYPVLIASGHHRIIGTIDADEDGRDELIFSGVANRMGWYEALAAVKVVPPRLLTASLASTPDADYSPSSRRALLWYALIGNGGFSAGTTFEIDPRKRQIVANFVDRPPLRLGLDGFPASYPAATSAQRSADRERAYEALREANRLKRSGYFAEARRRVGEGIAAADRSGDLPLASWARRVEVKIAIAGGAADAEIERLMSDVMRRFDTPSDACWEAANAFHRADRLESAIRWYREGLYVRTGKDRGRLVWEFVEGIVFALAELQRWDDARELVDVVARTHPNLPTSYRSWVEWRASGAFAEPFRSTPLDSDHARYVALESDAATDPDPVALLTRLDRELPRFSDSYRSILASLKAELQARSGEVKPALGLARKAFEETRLRIDDDTIARAHFELVAARYERIARMAGATADARTASRASAAFRARSR